MIHLLGLLILALALFQTGIERKQLACVYAFFTLYHGFATLYFAGYPDIAYEEWWLYYLSAALVDLVVIGVMADFDDNLAGELIDISIVSIFVNAIGCWMWYLYMPPDHYNNISIGLYCFAAFTLWERDVGYGSNETDWHNSWLYRHYH